MTHPLTDKEALSLFSFERLMDTSQPITIEDAMRTAADWQLEQDAKFFAQYLIKNEAFAPTVAELRAEWFKEAMRPQEDDQ